MKANAANRLGILLAEFLVLFLRAACARVFAASKEAEQE